MMALGKFALNIFGLPTASAVSCVEGIATAIAQLVTKVLNAAAIFAPFTVAQGLNAVHDGG